MIIANARIVTLDSENRVIDSGSVEILPGGVFGARPPYGPWKLLTLQDENTRQTLTRDELDERMAERLEKASAKFPLKP